LIRLDEDSEGILRAMIADKAQSSKITVQNEPVQLKIETFSSGSAYALCIESNKGRFCYTDTRLDRKGQYDNFSKTLEINGIEVTLEGLSGAKYAYGKLTEAQVGELLEAQLGKERLHTVLRYVPLDMKITQLTLKDGIHKFLAVDGSATLSYDTGIRGSNYCYTLPGDFSAKFDAIGAYGVNMLVEDSNETQLYGPPLLIIRLGRELLGKDPEPLLPQEAESTETK
jgi:hypothetical protein